MRRPSYLLRNTVITFKTFLPASHCSAGFKIISTAGCRKKWLIRTSGRECDCNYWKGPHQMWSLRTDPLVCGTILLQGGQSIESEKWVGDWKETRSPQGDNQPPLKCAVLETLPQILTCSQGLENDLCLDCIISVCFCLFSLVMFYCFCFLPCYFDKTVTLNSFLSWP